eukprot:gnl/MRDRNA2_/MRDRNA2_117335_c0_seq1.p1 gnl/MRDRNA2_/MRDRNA2_117335_c0~~gnl/MRDRNA2_/MRDRNA2_117335_c0_seq1.p1  ORF type:complete len:185 (-),score=18.08 gnl/MRDRNA2_/MRDRNA2_117335_c0_seq1:28-582(-)
MPPGILQRSWSALKHVGTSAFVSTSRSVALQQSLSSNGALKAFWSPRNLRHLGASWLSSTSKNQWSIDCWQSPSSLHQRRLMWSWIPRWPWSLSRVPECKPSLQALPLAEGSTTLTPMGARHITTKKRNRLKLKKYHWIKDIKRVRYISMIPQYAGPLGQQTKKRAVIKFSRRCPRVRMFKRER